MSTNNILNILNTPGAIVEKEGPRENSTGFALPPNDAALDPAFTDAPQNNPQEDSHAAPPELGPNNEILDDVNPRVVAALRDLMLQFRSEGLVARRHEVRRIKQARLFWQGLQYAWWNPNDMSWHPPFDPQAGEDKSLEEMPRYQFVTNLYQAFGLSFIALISQDTPTTRFFPQSAQIEVDVAAARAASDVAALVQDNNKVQQMLTGAGYFLWTDGKIGGYVRYVADAQRFGWHNEDIIEEAIVRIGEDAYVCPKCGKEILAATPARDDGKKSNRRDGVGVDVIPARSAAEGYPAAQFDAGNLPLDDDPGPNNRNFLAGAICPECGAPLGAENFHPAPLVSVPRYVGTRRVPNGQEVITILGGLELNTPVWANEMHEFPYLQWQQEVHIAKLRAAYPHAADKIILGGPVEAEDVYARASRVAVAQGMSSTAPGDALYNLITFTRTWIRPWAFYAIDDKQTRDELLAMFPDGCYVAFAGESYCESRNETLDDHWRVMHAMPGDGQNRPSVGDSLIQIQERYNTLSNIQAETYEFGIPPIYADPQVLDFDALASQTAEPAAHYPARAKPGQPLASSFFQPAPAQISPDMLEHQQDLAGPIAQFLTGLFPAVFGGVQAGNKTAAGYAMARDQALGRLGLVWRRLKQFYADIMLLSVDTFRKNRASDVEIPLLGAAGEFESKWIRLADLKGNIQAHPEADESFPRQASQQRAVLQQLMTSGDPLIQQALGDPENIGFIKGVFGLNELVVPGEDAREKQLREITQLLASAPIVVAPNEIPRPALRDGISLAPHAPYDSAGMRSADTDNFAGGVGVDVIPTRIAAEGYPAAQFDAGDPSSPPQALHASGQAGMPMPLESLLDAPPALANPANALNIPGTQFLELPSVPVDDLLDDHAAELAEVRRWASSDAGQIARAQNPVGFANVRAHAAAHQAALALTSSERAGGVRLAAAPRPRNRARQSAQAALQSAATQPSARQRPSPLQSGSDAQQSAQAAPGASSATGGVNSLRASTPRKRKPRA
jgi:hypothetical protein